MNITQNISLNNTSSSENNRSAIVIWSVVGIGTTEFILGVIVFIFLVRQSNIGCDSLRTQLIAISINDILAAISLIYTGIGNWSSFLRSNPVSCAAGLAFFLVTQFASLLTLGAIGIARLTVVINMRKQRTSQNSRLFIVAVLGIWTVSIALYATLFVKFGKYGTQIQSCKPEQVFGHNIFIVSAILILQSFVILLILNVIYLTTICIIKSIMRGQARDNNKSINMKQRCMNNKDTSIDADNVSTEDSLAIEATASKLSPVITVSVITSSMENSKFSSVTSVKANTVRGKILSCKGSQLLQSGLIPAKTSVNDNPKGKGKLSESETMRRLRKRNFHAVITLSSALIAVNIATLPFAILTALMLTNVSGLNYDAARIATLTLSLNSLFDPFVYIWRVKELRENIMKLIRTIFCKVCHSRRP